MTSWRTWSCLRFRRLWTACTLWSMIKKVVSSKKAMWAPWSMSWKVGHVQVSLLYPYMFTLLCFTTVPDDLQTRLSITLILPCVLCHNFLTMYYTVLHCFILNPEHLPPINNLKKTCFLKIIQQNTRLA